MKRKHINPKILPNWSGMFTQVVVTEKNGLKFIHISGQVGVDKSKKLAGHGSMEAQTDQALDNLKTALESAGANVMDIVKFTIYVVDYHCDQATIIRKSLRGIFPKKRLPALTLIGVTALADKHYLIEIDAEAIAESNP